MRFILRTTQRQNELEGYDAVAHDPDDYAVVLDGPRVGRIYPNPIDRSKWNWFLQSPVGASGYADTLDEAKEALKQRWLAETTKHSKQ
jgi:hypothetical protein